MKSVTIHEAKTHLSRLLATVAQGEEILVCKGAQPVARLVPLAPRRSRPRVGVVTSREITYAADCFEPLGPDELAEWGL